MDALTRMLVISVCAWAHIMTVGNALLPHRNYDERALGYSNTRDHAFGHPNTRDKDSNDQQYIYAAIPLHGPVPVLQVLSKKPISSVHAREPSVQHSVYVRAPYEGKHYGQSALYEDEYSEEDHPGSAFGGSSYGELTYVGSSYGGHHYDGSSDDRPSYGGPHKLSPTKQHAGQAASASHDDAAIIYARPNPNGGYLYRRPHNRRPPKRHPVRPDATTESPVVLRVHKYRIIRDRRGSM